MRMPLPDSTQPLSEDLTDLCLGCGGVLEYVVGWQDEQSYEGVRCPNNCPLEEWYD